MRRTIYEKKTGKPLVCEPVDARELVAGGAYTTVDPSDKTDPEGPPAPGVVLVGPSNWPAMVDLGPRQVPLGEIVAGAQVASGYDADTWNKLSAEARDKFLVSQVEILKAQAIAATLVTGGMPGATVKGAAPAASAASAVKGK